MFARHTFFSLYREQIEALTGAIHPYNHRAGELGDVHFTDQETEAHRKSLLNLQGGSDGQETAAPAFRTQSPRNLIKPGGFLICRSRRCFSSGSKPGGRSPTMRRRTRRPVSSPALAPVGTRGPAFAVPLPCPRLSGTRTCFSTSHFLFPSSESPATFGG